jgi:quinol monooxygenase YgiN
MRKIQSSVKFTIRPGKLDAFREVVRALCKTVNEKDKGGTLQYDWFLSTDGTTCIVRDTYADSGALLTHIENVAQLFPQLMETCCTFDWEVCGTMSDELLARVKDVPFRCYSYLDGLGASA